MDTHRSRESVMKKSTVCDVEIEGGTMEMEVKNDEN
jgi:hypothetical protein